MPSYKISYFNAKGRAELMRLICAAGDIKYEDNRFTREEWAALKPKTPLGQAPILEVDGVMYPQSASGARYLANSVGLAGKNDCEKFQADIIVDTIVDITNKGYAFMFEQDEKKKAEALKAFTTEYAPNIFKALTKFLETFGKNKGYFVESGLTWADLAVYDYFEKYSAKVDANTLKSYPKLEAHHKLVEKNPKVKAWLDKRPKTDM